jgi:protein-S-isoprenylcysteine O-methyltransferase Ste14
MPPGPDVQTQDRQADVVLKVGGWLFRQRTWLPLPIVAALLLIPGSARSTAVAAAGVMTVLAGEALRLWAVRHIGVISRTRSDRLGPLVRSGPFALMRNPLYVGNLLLWIGFGISAGLLWFVPIIVIVLGAEYHAIVRWEEGLLEDRLGDSYRTYKAEVGRWLPVSRKSSLDFARDKQVNFSWRETFFSERGTLIAIAFGYVLLWLKSRT